jgi:hypothetical protein
MPAARSAATSNVDLSLQSPNLRRSVSAGNSGTSRAAPNSTPV